jgi:hypothetical protein
VAWTKLAKDILLHGMRASHGHGILFRARVAMVRDNFIPLTAPRRSAKLEILPQGFAHFSDGTSNRITSCEFSRPSSVSWPLKSCTMFGHRDMVAKSRS